MQKAQPDRSDNLTASQRRACMAAIRSIDTQPEIIVRRLVHSLGYRYRLHSRKLPGKPDLVLSRYHCVIFVHGCFWHMHSCKRGKSTPQTNAEFWKTKREKSRIRDRKSITLLRRAGWRVLVLWECQIRNDSVFSRRIVSFIGKKLRPKYARGFSIKTSH